MFYSPLRYPGGKYRLAKFISKICIDNKVNGHYVEPYAGGASVALHLLLDGYVKKITINDYDRSIYAFWYSVLNYQKQLCDLIQNTNVNIKNWKTQRKVQERKNNQSLLKLGFSTFFLNRTNISGIINGGVIGGLKQKGKYKIGCRFNKAELIQRICTISKNKNKIYLYNLDAIQLIKKVQRASQKSKIIYYFDPPYYLKGSSLYENHYQHDDHNAVGEMIKGIKGAKWIVSYDNTLVIRKIYKAFKRKTYALVRTAHTTSRKKKGKEILFFNKNLLIPRVSNPVHINL